MSRFVYFSFFLIVIINEFANHEVCGKNILGRYRRQIPSAKTIVNWLKEAGYQGRNRRHIPSINDMGTWLENAKDDVYDWGSDKYEELSKKFETDSEIVQDNLEEQYYELLNELEEKREQLMNLPLYKEIEKLELALLTDEAGVEHTKETVEVPESTLDDNMEDKLETVQNFYEHNPLQRVQRSDEDSSLEVVWVTSEEAEAAQNEPSVIMVNKRKAW
ncbi:unnamed protein product [Psylliodes chrysocephalus]|uniref:Uncharacterized protein n=1 Tax=Psylliodes chrysocephalus TaxID=3402493 RepID=A0A9P0D8T3_9CUCU|nr:unnamed protein product [Psylliodes chrysocephala]